MPSGNNSASSLRGNRGQARTGPVRAWPRLPRSELALLFPDGKTQHHPADGGELTRDDVRRARANTDVAKQVAAYFDLRNHPKSPVEIAQAEAGIAPPAPILKSPPTRVARPAPEARVAAFETEVFEATPMEAPVPKLVQAPRLATPPPSDAERGGRIAKLLNVLNYANDCAWHFGLGKDFKAKKSKHMTGQAIDAAFPDIPLKQLRWSAAIRQVGGIGYYPTSGIPFVHVDTGPVRAWPRLPRSELALLFPDAKTQHHPADGGSLTRDDVRRARANTDVAKQVAAYFDLRNRSKSPVEIAQAEAGIAPPAPMLKSPPTQVARPAPEARVAAFETEVFEATPMEAPVPQLVQAPRPATPPPSDAERGRLNQLVTLASLNPTDVPAQRLQTADTDRYLLDRLIDTASVETPGPAPRPQAAAIIPKEGTQVASLDPAAGLDLRKPGTPTNAPAEGWAPAPEFDEDHPEELSYRPFPVAPLLTQSASADDEALVKIVHPNIERTLDLLDDRQIVLPMRLRPGDQVSEVLWAQQFQGSAVDFRAHETDPARAAASGLTSRPVKTTGR